MIDIKITKNGNALNAQAAIKINGTKDECVAEFAAVLKTLREANKEFYMEAVLWDGEEIMEELGK